MAGGGGGVTSTLLNMFSKKGLDRLTKALFINWREENGY